MGSEKRSGLDQAAIAIWCGMGLIACITAILLAGAFTNACDLPALMDPKQPSGGWCFEFWLFRYQTLIGAGAALAAAVVTWIVIQRQTRTNWDAVQLQLSETRVRQARSERVLVRTMLIELDALGMAIWKLRGHMSAQVLVGGAVYIQHLPPSSLTHEAEMLRSKFEEKWTASDVDDGIMRAVLDLALVTAGAIKTVRGFSDKVREIDRTYGNRIILKNDEIAGRTRLAERLMSDMEQSWASFQRSNDALRLVAHQSLARLEAAM